jgi:hypothetical protein
MSTNSLIQQQRDFIRRSRSVINDYERTKADAEARLKREKDAAEGAWEQARTEADLEIEVIRQTMNQVQNALDGSKWSNRIKGGTPKPFSTASTSTDYNSQFASYKLRVTSAGDQITKFLKLYDRPSTFYSTWGVIIGLVIFVGGLILWAVAIGPDLSSFGAIFTILNVFLVLMAIPLVATINQISRLKNNYATLKQSVSLSEDLHKRRLGAPQHIMDNNFLSVNLVIKRRSSSSIKSLREI